MATILHAFLKRVIRHGSLEVETSSRVRFSVGDGAGRSLAVCFADKGAERRDEALAIFDQRFCRMWEFYFAVCEVGFRHGGLMVFQIQLAKRQDAVPLTRDYIGVREAELAAGDMQRPGLRMLAAE